MTTDTQQIKDRIDIVQLIGEYINLKKAGANWKANCPFHNEKSPSFMVHAEKQIWHCFGCGKGGDVFSFVQEMEGLEFVEVLKLLGKRAGVEISFSKNEVDQSLRNRLLEINAAAANFFNRFLTDMSASEVARKYLQNRGLDKQTISQWQIGFVPDQWDLLTKYLLKKGFGVEDLISSGLTIKRDGADLQTGRGVYDRFRGRIMFPICDTHGNVVGFTGRVLVETENSGGKYVNTPQTLLYDKSRVLYGIHHAKTEMKSKDEAIIVEGQMDVIACHQAGMKNVIAASGTALTIDQVKLLKRYTNNVAMAFDADKAGQAAGKRGIEVALEQGMNIRVIQIPDGAGKDADECIKKNREVWFSSVKSATGIMNWYFLTTLKGVDLSNYKEKQRVTDILLPEIMRIPHGVERDEWLKKLGDELSVDIAVLREESKKIKSKKVEDKDKKTTTKENLSAPIPKTQLELLSEEFWSLLLKFPENFGFLAKILHGEVFERTSFGPLYEISETLYNRQNALIISELLGMIPQVEKSRVELLILRPTDLLDSATSADAKKELEQLVDRLKSEWKKVRGAEIQRQIAVAEKSGDKGLLEQLLVSLQKLKD